MEDKNPNLINKNEGSTENENISGDRTTYRY
jgi:hypothetical protein